MFALSLFGKQLGWSRPHDASLEGWRIDELIDVTSVFVGLIFAVMIGWMLWACFAHGEKHEARYDHGASRRGIALALGLVFGMFVVVDGHLFVSSISDWQRVFGNFARAESDPGAVRVEVNAHQWAWLARYAGSDGKFGTPDDVVTLDEIIVPQGAPIIFQIASNDVIHSLNIPSMRVKMDAVPGAINRLWFVAKETGEFEIACAQHCGANHYKMKGRLRVLPRADYDRWAARANVLAPRAYDASDPDAQWGWDWSEHMRP